VVLDLASARAVVDGGGGWAGASVHESLPKSMK
jgi:hypothetical protein